MFLLLASFVTLVSAAPRVLPNTRMTSLDVQNFVDIYPDLSDFGITTHHFHLQFKSSPWKVAIKDYQYILSMSMPDYEKQDIELLAEAGMLVMRAVHKEGYDIKKSQFVVSLLPDRVDPAGRWTYYDGELRVIFPIRGLRNNFGSATPDDGGSEVTQIVMD